MKPNAESAAENDANIELLVDTDFSLTEETRKLRQQLDETRQLAADLDVRLESNMAALAAATAQVQREQSERRRQEQRAAQLGKRLEDLHEDLRQHLQSEAAAREKSTALEEQFAQRSDTEAQLLADLDREMTEKIALREDLDAMASLNESLHGQIQHLEATAAELSATQQDLEQRLQTGAAALAEAKATTARAVEERARLENELNQVRVEAEAEARRNSAELARMRASLQVETLHRHRVESEALQNRSRLGEAERAGSASAVRFQQRMRTPVSTLVQSVGRLLDQELSPVQRELAESVLANAALVQTSLQDLGSGLTARRPGAISSTPTPAVENNAPPARGSGETPVQSSVQPAGSASVNVKQF